MRPCFFFAVWGGKHMLRWACGSPRLFFGEDQSLPLSSAQNTRPPQTREWGVGSGSANPQHATRSSPQVGLKKTSVCTGAHMTERKTGTCNDSPFTRFRRTLMHPLIRDVCIAHGSWPIHPRPTAVGVESFSTLRISNARFRGLFALYGLEFWNRHIPIESLLLQSRSAPLGSTKHVFSGLRHQNVLAYARFPGSFPPCTMRGSAGFRHKHAHVLVPLYSSTSRLSGSTLGEAFQCQTVRTQNGLHGMCAKTWASFVFGAGRFDWWVVTRSRVDINLHDHRPVIQSNRHPLLGSDMNAHSDMVGTFSVHPASPTLLTSKGPRGIRAFPCFLPCRQRRAATKQCNCLSLSCDFFASDTCPCIFATLRFVRNDRHTRLLDVVSIPVLICKAISVIRSNTADGPNWDGKRAMSLSLSTPAQSAVQEGWGSGDNFHAPLQFNDKLRKMRFPIALHTLPVLA